MCMIVILKSLKDMASRWQYASSKLTKRILIFIDLNAKIIPVIPLAILTHWVLKKIFLSTIITIREEEVIKETIELLEIESLLILTTNSNLELSSKEVMKLKYNKDQT